MAKKKQGLDLEFDNTEQRKLEGEMGRRVLGNECPIKNNSGDLCNECDRVRALFNKGDKVSEDLARGKMSKPSFFVQGFLFGTEEPTVIKLGKKVAGSLRSKSEKFGEKIGSGFGYADPAKGRWCRIEKEGETGGGNFASYEFSIADDVDEDIEIDKKLIDGLPALDNITEDFNEGKVNIFDVATLTSGGDVTFRMIPFQLSTGKYHYMVWRYYHWRCRAGDILGGAGIDETVGEKMPSEFSEYASVDEGASTPDPGAGRTGEDKPNCFGHFDADDDCLDSNCDKWREGCVAETSSAGRGEWTHSKKGWIKQ